MNKLSESEKKKKKKKDINKLQKAVIVKKYQLVYDLKSRTVCRPNEYRQYI